MVSSGEAHWGQAGGDQGHVVILVPNLGPALAIITFKAKCLREHHKADRPGMSLSH